MELGTRALDPDEGLETHFAEHKVGTEGVVKATRRVLTAVESALSANVLVS